MTCQRCGQRAATIHLVELVEGKRQSQWLCAVCAGDRPAEQDEPPGSPFGGKQGPNNPEEEDETLAAFLGQVFERGEKTGQAEPPACPTCGYTFGQFRQNNRLGCPRCYEAFRRPLLGILGHMHRHVTHLGKAPANVDGRSDRTSELSRNRVALEKAIAAEDFESAARLRDEIQRLESTEKREEDSES
jgi:protein arginine kinase activator